MHGIFSTHDTCAAFLGGSGHQLRGAEGRDGKREGGPERQTKSRPEVRSGEVRREAHGARRREIETERGIKEAEGECKRDKTGGREGETRQEIHGGGGGREGRSQEGKDKHTATES